jgi:CRP-like cAMP-binding protein
MFVLKLLNPLKVLVGEILYVQRDHAEEIYMIKSGKVKLLLETYELLGLKNLETEEEDVAPNKRTHYVPFIAYTAGSYFGDTDVF